MKRLCGCATLLLVCGCAGYHIGTESLYPANIQTVYVPIFRTNSFRRDLGERLTEAVIKEIELKTPFKVVNSPDADSVLTGEIGSDNKRLLVPAPTTGEPRETEISMLVHVTWVDKTGGALRNGLQVQLEPTPVDISASSKLVPEVGQSVVTAEQQAIQRAAQQIVAMMEAPW
jgi:hypothetical protein